MIGDLYKSFNNSYCINIKNGKGACIVQKEDDDYDYIGPNIEEDNAEFEIVSNPYQKDIECYGKFHTYTFINVKSSKTDNIYRVLYNEKCVIK